MEEIDIKELLGLFWGKRLEIIAITLLVTLVGIVYSYTMVTPKYSSYTTLVLTKVQENDGEAINTESITQSDITINSKLVSTYSELIKSNSVLREVRGTLNLENLSEGEMREKIGVTSVKDTELIKIVVEDEDAERAANIANEIAKVFAVKVNEIYKINNVYVVDLAESSSVPSNVNHLRDIAIAFVAGLVLACAGILIIKLLDVRVRNEQEVEKEVGLLVLALLPKHMDCAKEEM